MAYCQFGLSQKQKPVKNKDSVSAGSVKLRQLIPISISQYNRYVKIIVIA